MRFFILLTVAAYISCSPKKTSEDQVSIVDSIVASENSEKKFIGDSDESKRTFIGDTLQINHSIYYLDSIGEGEFKSIAKADVSHYTGELFDDSLNVKREGINLIFHLENGADSVLVTDTVDYEVAYKYIKDCSEINYWLVSVQYYEGNAYLLLNHADGEKIWLWGTPVFSPNGKRFISYSYDLEAQYNTNGFELFEIKSRRVRRILAKEIENWGPSEIFWKNDSTIYIKKVALSYSDSNIYETYTYRSLILK